MKILTGLRPFRSLQEVAVSVADLARSVAAGWNVDHNTDGTHKFEWTNVTYDAALFSSNAGTWSVTIGDVLVNRYRVIGHTMTVNLDVQNTSTSGAAAAYFSYAIPDNRVAAERMGGPCVIADNGTQDCGWWVVLKGTRVIRFYRHPQIASNWNAASSDNTSVVAHMEFEVQ